MIKRGLAGVFQANAAVLYQHLDNVVDGTDRTDQVVTQTRTQERRRLQIIQLRRCSFAGPAHEGVAKYA